MGLASRGCGLHQGCWASFKGVASVKGAWLASRRWDQNLRAGLELGGQQLTKGHVTDIKGAWLVSRGRGWHQGSMAGIKGAGLASREHGWY